MDKSQVLDVIVRSAKEVLPELYGHAITPTDRLADLGANSIDRSEILVRSLEQLELRIPLIHLASAQRLDEIVDVIHARL